MTSGVVNINGSALPAVRVEINPLALSKYGIGLQDVAAAISNANANAPKGAIESHGLHYQIYTNDNARDADQYRDLIIGTRNSGIIRLRDVAQILDMQDGATQNRRTYGIYNGKAAITVQVFQQPGANIIAVVDAVRKELPELKADIDPKIDMEVIQDRSITIRGSLHQVEETLVIAVLMVILVVYIFLNSFRAALIPAVVVPVSLLGTFSVMYLAGFSLDNFSLMALTIATGFVVDDAIVVMENTTRHIENGVKPMQAALLGAREVGFTVISMSLSLVAVFLPFQFLGGIIGRLFKEFTVTLSVAILISLVISLTTTPMMCARLLGRDGHKKPNAFARGFESNFESMRRGYERSLGFALNHPLLTMLSLIATIVLNFYLYTAIPAGFFPQQDTGQLQGGMRADATSSFGFIKGKLQQVTKIIQQDPAVVSVAGAVGGGGFGGNASAQFNVTLKPLAERKASADQVIARLRTKLIKVDGVITFLQAVQDLGGGGGGRAANSEYQYTLLGDDLKELRDWSQKLKVALQDVPEVTDVDTDLQPGGLETDLIVDRDAAARLGLNESIIDSALGNSFTQALTSTIYNPFSPQQYHVVMEVAPEYLPISGDSELAVHQYRGGHDLRHPGHAGGRRHDLVQGREHLGHRRGQRCGPQPRIQFAGQRRSRQYLHRRGRQRRGRNRGAVLRLQPLQHLDDPHQRQPHRDLDLDLLLLQPPRGGGTEHRAGRHRTDHGAHPHAHQHPRQPLWHGAAVPAAVQRSAADPAGGAAGDLRGAGHALRELHPAPDHHLDAALGGPGRAAGADAHEYRTEPGRVPGDHAADRHRQEERHHDGGLRAGRGAQPRAGFT